MDAEYQIYGMVLINLRKYFDIFYDSHIIPSG